MLSRAWYVPSTQTWLYSWILQVDGIVHSGSGLPSFRTLFSENGTAPILTWKGGVAVNPAVSSWCVLQCYTNACWVIIWISGNTFIISLSFHYKYLLLLISRAKTKVVEVSASGWSLFQRSPTKFGVSECDREASLMRTPWPIRDCCTMEKRNLLEAFESRNDHSVINKLFSVTVFEI
jgi:hypothetical protein